MGVGRAGGGGGGIVDLAALHPVTFTFRLMVVLVFAVKAYSVPVPHATFAGACTLIDSLPLESVMPPPTNPVNFLFFRLG